MANYDLKLLDCTLRDGGYINDWRWGFQTARDIVQSLAKAGIDVIEVGFLRDVAQYDPDVTVCNTIEELNRLLPDVYGHTMFSGMAMRSNYDIKKLSPYSGQGIEMIRITAHDYDIKDGMDFAREVKDKGYKLSINPINIMGYNDEQILWIIEQVNEIEPYQFSIVDTFGSMKRRDLDRITSLVDHNLDRNIRVALHLHENMALSCSLAQNFIDKHLNRPIAVDASLLGMGRIPGNLPIELISDYLNEYTDKAYDIDCMMDAIQDYIEPIKGEPRWGYTPAFFLSARFNLHRNYAEYYLEKGDLTNRDINHILAGFSREKSTVFDAEYADELYKKYKNKQIDDSQDRKRLSELLCGKEILLLAPGPSIVTRKEELELFIKEHKPVIISVNFVPETFEADYSFFSNNKRYDKIGKFPGKTIVTSNLREGTADYRIDYDGIAGVFEQGYNSYIMLLKLLSELGVENVFVGGADGYSANIRNYYKTTLKSSSEHAAEYNLSIKEAVEKINMTVTYITPSAYA